MLKQVNRVAGTNQHAAAYICKKCKSTSNSTRTEKIQCLHKQKRGIVFNMHFKHPYSEMGPAPVLL